MYRHITKIMNAGTWSGWQCTCGKRSRRLAPHWRTHHNATAHERRAEEEDFSYTAISRWADDGGR